MKVAVNDLAFEYSLYEREKALDAVKTFIYVCKQLEAKRCHSVQRITGLKIDSNKELYKGGSLYRIIQELDDRDEKRYFLSLLTNREAREDLVDAPFVFQGKSSFTCAAACKEAVVSIRTEKSFWNNKIHGEINGRPVSIRNISCEEHIHDYREILGIREYQANREKHKKDRENPYGKGKIGSPMDLSDEEAQELLDRAIIVNNRLYARKGKKNYAFQKTRECIYHGYIDTSIGQDVITALDKMEWD